MSTKRWPLDRADGPVGSGGPTNRLPEYLSNFNINFQATNLNPVRKQQSQRYSLTIRSLARIQGRPSPDREVLD